MTENNGDAQNTVEENALEMIDEGAPVEPQTDPERELKQEGE